MNMFGKKMQMIQEEKVIEGGKVNTIRITSGLADVHVAAGSGDDIQILLEGEISESVADNLEFNVRQNGSILAVNVKKHKGIVFGAIKSDLHLYVTVPSKVYEDFHVKLGSGDCIVNNIDTKSYTGIISSGNQIIAGLHAKKQLMLKGSSGDLLVKNSHADSVMAWVTSGSINISDLVWKRAKFDATSGEIEISSDKLASDTACKVTSGDIRVHSGFFEGELDCRATSGDVEISSEMFPEDLHVDCHISSGSRKVRIEGLTGVEEQKGRFHGVRGDGSANSIRALTTSGNIRILD
ncbi:DUF4097 family beta strand repeat-containing protein [Virgibacillus ihumii]|uniref:DUF4097 family beta strand repeat-containing protein n=1 Tax=Virgibacillus ihumii TaxID=2686091 RepID=UPI00157BDA2D|nr:DUF4097 family beta strand repeat-containing protein [Virgibacillus ihumii]